MTDADPIDIPPPRLDEFAPGTVIVVIDTLPAAEAAAVAIRDLSERRHTSCQRRKCCCRTRPDRRKPALSGACGGSWRLRVSPTRARFSSATSTMRGRAPAWWSRPLRRRQGGCAVAASPSARCARRHPRSRADPARTHLIRPLVVDPRMQRLTADDTRACRRYACRLPWGHPARTWSGSRGPKEARHAPNQASRRCWAPPR